MKRDKKKDLSKEYKKNSREMFKDVKTGSYVIDSKKFKKPKYKEFFDEEWDEIDEEFWKLKKEVR